MIKKLSKRIFLIIMTALSIVILGIIILFTFFNYTNTIRTSTSMLDRFINFEPRNAIGEKDNADNNMNFDLNFDGVYIFRIENSNVSEVSDKTYDEKIEQYAIKVNGGKNQSGIIGDYIYKTRKTKGSNIVILMENKTVVMQIKKIIIFSVLGCIVSLIIIYGIAKKLSVVIVKPIQETFEKQKQFISDASHELKTPLAVIEANTDVLEGQVGNNKWISYIQNEIDSMNKLINELLLLAKMENVGELKEYKELDISKETEIIVSMFESMAYEKNVLLKSDVQENIMLNGNKEDVEHILSTLIDNAIKHTEKSKEVIVELKRSKNNITWQVKNMGEPIPEDEREKIFERFYRIDKSRNRKEKRYGLGLAIAKSTVQRYGGNIEVLYKDGFTIFRVSMPA